MRVQNTASPLPPPALPTGKRLYFGRRAPDGTLRVEVLAPGRGRAPLPHIIMHSPSGFEWGHGGSGPSDLALAILADALGESARLPVAVFERYAPEHAARIADMRAWALHHAFKWDVIARLPRRGSWMLTSRDVRNWLAMQPETAVTA